MHSNAKPSKQCVEAAKRANRILGMTKRTIVSREQDVVLRLYKSLVRPHLEYCVQAWSPYLRQDIDTLEQVQRRATKMIRGLGKFTYEERLMRCGLTNLEKEKNKGRPNRSLQDYDWKGSNFGTSVLRSQFGKQNQRTRIQAL